MARASRVAIRTVKAVKTVEERLTAVEKQLVAVRSVLQQLVAMVHAAKERAEAEEAQAKTSAKPSKARTLQKRGGA